MRALSVAVLILLIADVKLYASCCSSAATSGVGRLLRHERASVELATATKLVTGHFDDRARFKGGHPPMSPYLVVEPELIIVARVFDFLEPFAKIPLRIQKSDLRVGAHIADISLGARASIVREDIITGFPAISLIGSVRMPTGESMTTDAEDRSGTGNYLLSASILLEKEIAQINFAVGYGLSLEPDYFRPVSFKPGLIHSPLFAIGFSPHESGLLSCTWSMNFHGQPQFESRSLIDADKRKMTIALAYSRALHSHIKVNVQLGSDVPFSYLGKNITSEAFIRFGLRFGVF